MKRILSIILAMAMVLTMAACGSKEPETTTAEATTVPVTEATTTAADTTTAEATTPAATEATTEEPTEAPDEGGQIDKDAQAEDVFTAMMANLESFLRKLADKDAEAEKFTLEGNAEGGITAFVSMGEQSMELPVKANADFRAEGDSSAGFYGKLGYDADLGMLSMMMGGDGSEGPMKGTLEVYADLATQRIYESTEDGWVYSELELEEEGMLPEDVHFDQYKLEDLFKEYNFRAEEDAYIFDGIMKMDLGAAGENAALLPEEMGDMMEGLSLEDLQIKLQIKADAEKRLTGLKLSVDAMEIDLSDLLEGFKARIDGIAAELNILYGQGEYNLPKEVEENATEKQDDYDDWDTEYPWSKDVYVVDGEELVSNEQFTVTVSEVRNSDFGDLEVDFRVKNNTDDTLVFDIEEIAVDGMIVNNYYSHTVMPKAEDTQTLRVYADKLELSNIRSIDEISFLLEVRDKGTYADPHHLEHYTIYPTGKDPKDIEYPERRTGANEMVLLDNEDVLVMIISCEKDQYGDHNVTTYAENRRDTDLYISFENVTFNDIEPEEDYTWLDIILPAHSKGHFEESFYDLDEWGIETVEKLSGTMVIEDDKWDEIYTEPFVYEVK